MTNIESEGLISLQKTGLSDLKGCGFTHVIQSNCILQVYYMSTKSKLNVVKCKHMFHSHSNLNPTLPTPSTFPS